MAAFKRKNAMIEARTTNWLTTLADAKAAPMTAGLRSAQMLEYGSMKLRYYAPRGKDEQTPHDQDELYIVVAGQGVYAIGEAEASLERQAFGAGDVLFAPAGLVHQFENFSDDFATWVVFWGPKGGESNT
jgi:oxalate decarboxylase/phosphoglucose isomerase-like protein (cupin superfamily)